MTRLHMRGPEPLGRDRPGGPHRLPLVAAVGVVLVLAAIAPVVLVIVAVMLVVVITLARLAAVIALTRLDHAAMEHRQSEHQEQRSSKDPESCHELLPRLDRKSTR